MTRLRSPNVDGCGTSTRDSRRWDYNFKTGALPKAMHFSSSLSFVGGEIVDLVLQTGAVAKFVLFVLLIAFSMLSWAVILSKWTSYQPRPRAEWKICPCLSKSAAHAGHGFRS